MNIVCKILNLLIRIKNSNLSDFDNFSLISLSVVTIGNNFLSSSRLN